MENLSTTSDLKVWLERTRYIQSSATEGLRLSVGSLRNIESRKGGDVTQIGLAHVLGPISQSSNADSVWKMKAALVDIDVPEIMWSMAIKKWNRIGSGEKILAEDREHQMSTWMAAALQHALSFESLPALMCFIADGPSLSTAWIKKPELKPTEETRCV